MYRLVLEGRSVSSTCTSSRVVVLEAHLLLHPVALNSCTVLLASTVLLHKQHGFVMAVVKHVKRHTSIGYVTREDNNIHFN